VKCSLPQQCALYVTSWQFSVHGSKSKEANWRHMWNTSVSWWFQPNYHPKWVISDGCNCHTFYLSCVIFFKDLTHSYALLIGERLVSFVLQITVAVTSYIRAAHVQPSPSILSSHRLRHESWLFKGLLLISIREMRSCVMSVCTPIRCVKNARFWYL